MLTCLVTDTGPKREAHAPVVDALVDLYGPNEKEYKSAPDKSENVLQSAETDAGGCYRIDNLEPGYYWASCDAFTPKGHGVKIEAGYSARLDFQLDVALQLTCLTQARLGRQLQRNRKVRHGGSRYAYQAARQLQSQTEEANGT
jgi:hypothetical protein